MSDDFFRKAVVSAVKMAVAKCKERDEKRDAINKETEIKWKMERDSIVSLFVDDIYLALGKIKGLKDDEDIKWYVDFIYRSLDKIENYIKDFDDARKKVGINTFYEFSEIIKNKVEHLPH